jgi:hypothetical protein
MGTREVPRDPEYAAVGDLDKIECAWPPSAAGYIDTLGLATEKDVREAILISSTKCPRCDGPKERGVHDCAACSRKIAENVSKQEKRTKDGGAHGR